MEPFARIGGDGIREYEFVVQLRLAGHGPTLFAGLSKRIDLRLVSGLGLYGSGAVAIKYEPRRYSSDLHPDVEPAPPRSTSH
jgi:hypothetical protein